MSNEAHTVDLMPRLEQCLPARARELVAAAAQIAGARGQGLYLVGGVVRDLLLNRACLDIDLVLEGNAVELARELAGGGGERATVHPSFCTATLKGTGFSVDLAMARREEYSRPGALPRVRPGNIRDDLFRRDFSLNAMAISLTPARRGELLDPWGGRADIERGLVRILHDRSFVDDATRILRAIRYEQRFAFQLEPSTEFMLVRDIAFLDTLSGDRVRHELERIFAEEYPERALRRAGELGVLARLHPALGGDGWLEEAFASAREIAGPLPVPLCYALLLLRLSEAEAEGALSHLNGPRTARDAVNDTLRLRRGIAALSAPDMRHSEVFALLQGYSPHAVMANLVAGEEPRSRERMRLFLDSLRHVRASLKGDDLLKMGAPAGPRLGELLALLHRARLDGEVASRADEVALARRLLASQDREEQ